MVQAFGTEILNSVETNPTPKIWNYFIVPYDVTVETQFTDDCGELVKAQVGDQVVGADHVPEPSQVELARHAGLLLKAGLKIFNPLSSSNTW